MSAPKSSRCDACGQFFIREASLTKHLRNNCSVAHKRSRELWKNGPSNIKKLNTLLTGSRKRVHEEVRPHDSYRVQVKQPASPSVDVQGSSHGFELVCMLRVVYSALTHTHFFLGRRD
jgi:hypothetical protein